MNSTKLFREKEVKHLFFLLSNALSLNKLRGCSYGDELAELDGLVRLGEMIFIPRSYGIFYLSSIKRFVKKIIWSNKQ